jgi:hypothetical protein
MRVPIDECIDERFRKSLPEHDCQTARYAGLAGLKNGELLIAAETAKFDVFLTVDQGIEYQQNLTGRNIAIIIFRTKSNRLKNLLPHVRACLAYIESILRDGRITRTLKTGMTEAFPLMGKPSRVQKARVRSVLQLNAHLVLD